MPHVLVAGRIHEAGRDLLAGTPGITFDLVDEVSTESYAPLVDRADAILIRTQPMPAEVIARAGRLQIVSRHGVGYDAVDVAALDARGIPLTVVGDVNSGAVAEHTLTLMLALAKKVVAFDAATRSGGWNIRNTFSATELAGKTLLLVGFGRIGRKVCALARAFDMSVVVHDRFVPDEDIRSGGAEPARDLQAALRVADVVSVHVPLEDGKALIGGRELAAMKPGAFVVNTARGGLVDEVALAEALAQGRIGGAGLDVFAQEPPAAGHPLLSSERVVLSPHSAGLTAECARRMAIAAVRNILDYFDGRLDPSLVVNRDAAVLRPVPA
jgi:D-3-phosphoglycerate dehydrogenase / 2-oxoglutarate reductase